MMALSGSEAALDDHVPPDEAVQQAVRQVVEVVQAVAQVGVGLAHHPGAVVRLDALDRGLRRQARGHGLAHAPQPALVVGEHPEGLEDLPVLAVMGDVAAVDQLVDRGADVADGLLEALELRVDVLGDEVLDHHPRLVQHHVAEADALGERRRRAGAAGGAGRCRRRTGASAWSSPDAIISASTMAVVWSASISSSA